MLYNSVFTGSVMLADEVRQKVFQLHTLSQIILRYAFTNWNTWAQKQAQKKASIALALRLEQEHYMIQPHAMRLEQEHYMVQPRALLEVLAQAKFLVHGQVRAQALVHAPAQVSQHQNQILERLAEHLEQAQCLAQAYAQHTQAQQLERQARKQKKDLNLAQQVQEEEDLNLARQVQEEETLNLARQVQEEENIKLVRFLSQALHAQPAQAQPALARHAQEHKDSVLARELAKQFKKEQAQIQADSELAKQFKKEQAQNQADSELVAFMRTIPDLE